MTPEELKKRTKQFALRIIRLCDTLPRTRVGNVLATQLIRSATSVGADYRAAGAQMPTFSKIGITLEEADESVHWMEIIVESGMKTEKQLFSLIQEGNELAAIFVASSNTAHKRMRGAVPI